MKRVAGFVELFTQKVSAVRAGHNKINIDRFWIARILYVRKAHINILVPKYDVGMNIVAEGYVRST